MHNHKALKGRKILFKTLFGSKLYGTNTPTSDEDWKEVFLPRKEFLLVGRKPTNVVVSTGNDHARNTKDDVDYEYIPIQVFANDFIGGQTYAVELAFAVLSEEFKAGQEVYDLMFLDFVHELTEKFLTSNIKAMIGYAMNQAQIYGIKGTRLASVRKFTDKVAEVLASGEFKSEDKLEVLEPWVNANADKYLFMTTYENMDKKLPGVSVLEKTYPLSITIGEAQERTIALKAKYGSRAESAEAAKGIDWKATAHAVRITCQAIAVLRDKELKFPFDDIDVKLLLSIKNGERSFDEVAEMLTTLFAKLDETKETTTLPERTPELDAAFELWLEGWMLKFYE
jgi:hypothetical protein